MKNRSISYRFRIFVSLMLLPVILFSGCASADDFDSRLNGIVKPYRFSIFGWEVGAVAGEIGGLFSEAPETDDQGVARVEEYFALSARIRNLNGRIAALGTGAGEALQAELADLRKQRETMTPVVEAIIESQVLETLSSEGIYNPFIKPELSFPPVSFRLSELPLVLVVSPRDRIESMREITLEPGLTAEQKEEIEAEVDALGVSSLVTRIGGIATYPTLVSDSASLRYTLETAVEEWVHHYLAFTPLGFRYILDLTGISRDYDIATMNETVAGMVSGEIAGLVYERYYGGAKADDSAVPDDEGFDFNREMREIRIAVDEMLSDGEIDEAEAYMEERRLYMAGNGYVLRKLNQAYFAFHGAYADSPASVSPIGAELAELRDRSGSVKEFLDIASSLTERAQLQENIR